MKLHHCPTCGQPYRCSFVAGACRSPFVYDCFPCYLRRHLAELELLVAGLAERLGAPEECAGHGDSCHAH